jgi:protein phosphatase
MSSLPDPTVGAQQRSGQVIVHVFGRTDVGRTREHNEDSFAIADLTTDNASLQPEVLTHVAGERGSLFMVADGMGGAAAGEIASAMAVEVVLGELRTQWIQADSANPELFVRAIKKATKAANERINTYATAHPEYRGMGTTATIAGLLGDTLYLAQVGDSRAYVVRQGVASQITKDQSLMQKLIEAGELTEEEAEHSERRNIILQALGPDATVKVDLTHQSVRQGDTLVLCSDGLSGQVPKEAIAAIVAAQPDLQLACDQLVELANDAGGPDNITVILARFEGEGLQPVSGDDEVGHRPLPQNDTRTTPVAVVPRPVEEARVEGFDGLPDGLPDDLPRDITRVIQSPVFQPPRPTAISAALPAARPVAQPSPVRSWPRTPPEVANAEPPVSPSRRSAGMLIAMLLLVVLIGSAAWLILRTARNVAPAADTSARAKATTKK